MTDYSELKRLAKAANAVTSDVGVEMTLASESGPNQEEVDAVTAFLAVATPAAVLALIAENDHLAMCSRQWEEAAMQWGAERDQLKAENEALRKDSRVLQWIEDNAHDDMAAVMGNDWKSMIIDYVEVSND